MLKDLRITAIQKQDFEYKVVTDKNFNVVINDLPIIKSLNNLINSKNSDCFDKFLDKVPLLIVLRDEIHISIIDKFIDENIYIYPGCLDTLCSKEAVYEIIVNAPILLTSKHTVNRNHPLFGNYFLEANKPMYPDYYTHSEAF